MPGARLELATFGLWDQRSADYWANLAFSKGGESQALTVAVFNMYKFLKNIYMLVSHYITILLQHAYYQTHTNTFLPLEAYSYTLSITLILLHAY